MSRGAVKGVTAILVELLKGRTSWRDEVMDAAAMLLLVVLFFDRDFLADDGVVGGGGGGRSRSSGMPKGSVTVMMVVVGSERRSLILVGREDGIDGRAKDIRSPRSVRARLAWV